MNLSLSARGGDVASQVPLITIGITCYNASATIARAIESARRQSWPQFEIVIVDDGSQDGSVSIIQSFVDRDARIRFYRHKQNLGCAAARNAIVRFAKGEFIAFFDDDDVSHPDRLQIQFDHIIAYQRSTGATLVACYTSGRRRYENGYEMPFLAVGSQGKAPIGAVLADYLLTFDRIDGIFYGNGTPCCSLMARAGVFAAVGPFDERLRRQEDGDFAIRLAFLGGHFIGTPEQLLLQYATEGAEKKAFVEHESYRALLIKNEQYLRKKGRFRYALGWAEVRFRYFNRQWGAAGWSLLLLLIRYPLRTLSHFLTAASRRLLHERRIKASLVQLI